MYVKVIISELEADSLSELRFFDALSIHMGPGSLGRACLRAFRMRRVDI